MRSEKELIEMLDEHLGFLKISFREFDNGNLREAKRIANSIYTIVFDKGRTSSILAQLGWKEKIAFISSGNVLKPPKDPMKDWYQSPPLLMMVGGPQGLAYIARLGHTPDKHRMMSFEEWWREDPIYWYQESYDLPQKIHLLSREALVLSLTDQDGGRHLDPKISNKHYRWMKEDQPWVNVDTGEKPKLSAELVTARQVGWELVESLTRYRQRDKAL